MRLPVGLCCVQFVVMGHFKSPAELLGLFLEQTYGALKIFRQYIKFASLHFNRSIQIGAPIVPQQSDWALDISGAINWVLLSAPSQVTPNLDRQVAEFI